MIESGRNRSINMRERESKFRPTTETQVFPDIERRNAVRKSKSVGYSNAPGLWMLAEIGGRGYHNNVNVNRAAVSTNFHNNRIDTRTVKSDTCLSPPKQRNIDLIKKSDHYASKKSPASVCDIDKHVYLQRTFSEKKSLSNNGNSFLEIISGHSVSHRATFNLSSCFSDDDKSEVSSFADDDILSLPTTVRFSGGNISMPSELTVSQSLEICSPQSKPEERRKLTHNASRNTIDVIPRPPRRKHSGREFSTGKQSKPLVPKQIECFPMDESPMRPSRQTSASSSSILTKVSTIDLSPKMPRRHNSDKSSDSETSNLVRSGLSVDSLPQQPQRQESNRSLTYVLHMSSITKTKNHNSSHPPIRKVYRSESQLQPHLPFLSRRTSIMEKPKDFSTGGTTHSSLR